MSFIVASSYGWVLFEAVLISLQCYVFGFYYVYSVRKQFFSKEFFSTHFPHLKPHPQEGYPDTGNGRYSDKLTEDQWRDFNNRNRIHYNYLEGLGFTLTVLLVSGLHYPRVALIGGLGVILSRFLYSAKYKQQGARGRMVGALFNYICLIVLLVTSFMTCYHIGGGVQGLNKTLFA